MNKGMDISQEQQDRYVQVLGQYAETSMTWECDLLTGMVIVGALQLAIRHPGFPPESRRVITKVLREFEDKIAQIDPTLAEGFRWGDDPNLDVPF